MTLRELLTLMQAMEKDLADRRVDDFYYLSRAALVKDERNLDKFDRVFARVFKRTCDDAEAWRRRSRQVAQEAHRKISHRRRKRQIEAMGSLDKLLETLRRRLQSRKAATKAAANGQLCETFRSAPTATTRKHSHRADRNRNFRAVKVGTGAVEI